MRAARVLFFRAIALINLIAFKSISPGTPHCSERFDRVAQRASAGYITVDLSPVALEPATQKR
jgi:hypothetical protein